MADALKPCPHCGWKAEVAIDDFAGAVTGENRHSVVCNNLRCRAGQTGFDTPENAIAAWNRRAPDPRIALAKMKQLEWVEGGREYLDSRTVVSETIVGRYILEQYSNWCVYFSDQLQSTNHLNEAAAKVAAQADYERRILSAVEPVSRIPAGIKCDVTAHDKEFFSQNGATK